MDNLFFVRRPSALASQNTCHLSSVVKVNTFVIPILLPELS